MNEHDKSVARQVLLVYIGFMAVVFILLAATVISLAHLGSQNERLKELVGKQNVKSELMHQMRHVIRDRMVNVFTISNLRDPFDIEDEWEKYTRNAEDFLIARQALFDVGITPLEQKTIESQKDALSIGQQVMDAVIDLMRNGQYNAARQEISKARTANIRIDDELETLIRIAEQVNQEAVKQATQLYLSTRSQIFLLDLVATILCLAIIAFVVHQIRSQQEALTDALVALEASNENLEARVLGRTEDLMAARDAALSASKSKSRFLANMSHELRTPLNAIIGYSEMLIEDAEDLGYQESLEDLGRIQSAGKHLLDLISDVLDISKIEAGKMQVVPEMFSLRHLLQEVIDTMKPLMEQKRNVFELEYDERVTDMLADPTRVRQILFNLMSNAAKFTEGGKISLLIKQEVCNDTPWVICVVKDTGIGISREQQDKLFQAFVQADDSSTRKYGGTGLGLVISLRFCQLMGGNIAVESELGHGCQFTVSLPQYIEASEAQDELEGEDYDGQRLCLERKIAAYAKASSSKE